MIFPVMRCDRCGAIRKPSALEQFRKPFAVVIREMAHQEGWDVGSPKDFDICPRCWMAILDEEATE